jgi:hypothetical protein
VLWIFSYACSHCRIKIHELKFICICVCGQNVTGRWELWSVGGCGVSAPLLPATCRAHGSKGNNIGVHPPVRCHQPSVVLVGIAQGKGFRALYLTESTLCPSDNGFTAVWRDDQGVATTLRPTHIAVSHIIHTYNVTGMLHRWLAVPWYTTCRYLSSLHLFTIARLPTWHTLLGSSACSSLAGLMRVSGHAPPLITVDGIPRVDWVTADHWLPLAAVGPRTYSGYTVLLKIVGRGSLQITFSSER